MTPKEHSISMISQSELQYLELLSSNFPSIASASAEIINLEAILNLPKGTEHFLTDLHGEHEAFDHVIKNASGAIKRKVNEIFGNTLREAEKKEICTLIYYPEQKLRLIENVEDDIEDWYMITLTKLVKICQNVSSKYTRSKVRKALPPEFTYIIQELLHESSDDRNKQGYIGVIISTIISTNRAKEFIVAICNLIQRLTIDRLHIVGDIYDRGAGAHIIMDTLCRYHNFDIQWGNHDILWIGAAAGNTSCIANVIRMAMRYANSTTLEDGYGINLLPLATFAIDTYFDDPCNVFKPKVETKTGRLNAKRLRLVAQMHKAITVIQFKLEAEIISRRPEFEMQHRNLLEHIDFEHGTFTFDGTAYPLLDTLFPTIDPKDPYKLTDEEAALVEELHYSFVHSEKLRLHMRCLFANGGMYLSYNSNLLFHASVPLNEDGSFKKVELCGKKYHGKKLMDKIDGLVRLAYLGDEDHPMKEFAVDYMWYMWCGKDAPSFDKSMMRTFERYFIADSSLHKEEKGYYYKLRDNEDICNSIIKEFDVTGEHTHIINGHVPVKAMSGERPIKANGKLLVIDGGFSKAYQPATGIAGYTLVYHSHGLELVQHEPFVSTQKAIEEGLDIKSTTIIVEYNSQRVMVKDTDMGKKLRIQIEQLSRLLSAYRVGIIKEQL
ncbi:MAG: fructose-1,6-bisphosphatase [Rikenellaceae bacterium]